MKIIFSTFVLSFIQRVIIIVSRLSPHALKETNNRLYSRKFNYLSNDNISTGSHLSDLLNNTINITLGVGLTQTQETPPRHCSQTSQSSG